MIVGTFIAIARVFVSFAVKESVSAAEKRVNLPGIRG
jgi:hypothetical protein